MIWKGTKAQLMTFKNEQKKNTELSNLTFQFHQQKLHFLTRCYTKTKITRSKQLYFANQNQDIQDP